jgi:hypothetical protein
MAHQRTPPQEGSSNFCCCTQGMSSPYGAGTSGRFQAVRWIPRTTGAHHTRIPLLSASQRSGGAGHGELTLGIVGWRFALHLRNTAATIVTRHNAPRAQPAKCSLTLAPGLQRSLAPRAVPRCRQRPPPRRCPGTRTACRCASPQSLLCWRTRNASPGLPSPPRPTRCDAVLFTRFPSPPTEERSSPATCITPCALGRLVLKFFSPCDAGRVCEP